MPPSIRTALQGDHHSRQVVAALFIDALGPLSEPAYKARSRNMQIPCLDAVCMSMSILLTVSGRPITRLRKEFPEVIRVSINWLVQSPSGQVQDKMLNITFSNYPPCRCDKHHPISREIHNTVPKDPVAKKVRSLALGPHLDKSPLHGLLRCILSAVNCAFADIVADGPLKPLKYAERALQRGKHPPWPSRTSDMLPEPMEASLCALSTWEEWCDRTVLLELLHAIYVLCAAPMFPRVLLLTIIPLGWAHVMARVINAWNFGPRNGSLRARCGKTMRAAERILQDALALHTRQMTRFIRPSDVDKWTNTVRMVWSAHNVLMEMNEHENEEARGAPDIYLGLAVTFREFAVRLHHAIGAPMDEHYKRAFIAVSAQHTQAPSDPLADLAFFAPFMYRARLCASAECPLLYNEFGQVLRACAGCGHTYYCTTRCQKAAWRAPDVPHKDICAPLRSVTSAVPRPKLDASGYLEDSVGFIQRCRSANVDMRLVSSIIDHFAAIYSR